MVGKLQARGIGGGVFEVDDNELLVLICRQEQRRLCGRLHAKKIAILSLETSQYNISQYLTKENLHHCARTPTGA